ncbi:helix-turn-helix domain-containing protein [Iodobacter sp.]|uniref:helix-turn-helix domain-containing protein n=1 Tax=Iodobacter sp. TaxID=1915058 RepID=UPI0025ECCACB|nr:AraC family transcriptional regulator [Iodobacter sp.]
MTPSRLEYIARFNRVLGYIDQHLDEELNLDLLASLAYFSPFHFHRIFSAWHGATLAEYIRRRRLEIAACRLLHRQNATVLDIALGCGFGSGESFSRAFRQHFDCTPSIWQKRKPSQARFDTWRDHEWTFNPLPICAKLAPMAQPSLHCGGDFTLGR